MKKVVAVAAVAAVAIVGIAFVAKRFTPKLENIDWEKRFAAMPDNAPPKWMFHNISEIHDNTQRILELLEESSEEGTGRGAIEDSVT
jgi:hypothetical protein